MYSNLGHLFIICVVFLHSRDQVVADEQKIGNVTLENNYPDMSKIGTAKKLDLEQQFQLISKFLEDFKQSLQEEKDQLERDKKLFKEMSEKIEKTHFSSVVTLNIGILRIHELPITIKRRGTLHNKSEHSDI
jgi:hypothetical protein